MSISTEDHGTRRRRCRGACAAVAALVVAASSCSASETTSSTTTTTIAVILPATSAVEVTTTATTVAAATTAAPETSAPPTTLLPTTVAPTTVAPTTPPTTVAPTTTIDPLRPAREQFRVITSTATAAGTAIAEQHPLTDWSAYPAYCAEMAVVARTLADAITASSWPAGATALATDLSAGHVYLATLYEQCAATDGTYEELISIDETLRQVHDYVSNANIAMRLALGFRPDR